MEREIIFHERYQLKAEGKQNVGYLAAIGTDPICYSVLLSGFFIWHCVLFKD